MCLVVKKNVLANGRFKKKIDTLFYANRVTFYHMVDDELMHKKTQQIFSSEQHVQ